MSDEFYLGYSKSIPPKIRKFLLVLIPSLVVLMAILAVVLTLLHNQYSAGTYTGFDEFEGLLLDKPIPHLVVTSTDKTNNENGYSRYILASTRKSSVSPDVLKLTGNWVKLRAIPVFRDGTTLLAVSTKTPPEVIEPSFPKSSLSPGESLGSYTLTGEIVDPKCYLGVMNPGMGKTHLKCAVRCISGGIPPTLRVRNQTGDVFYFLLVDKDGNSLNSRILDLVAQPVQVTGEVVRYDDLFVVKGFPEKLTKG